MGSPLQSPLAGEYTQGRLRVVPVEMSEDYDVYPVTERTKANR